MPPTRSSAPASPASPSQGRSSLRGRKPQDRIPSGDSVARRAGAEARRFAAGCRWIRIKRLVVRATASRSRCRDSHEAPCPAHDEWARCGVHWTLTQLPPSAAALSMGRARSEPYGRSASWLDQRARRSKSQATATRTDPALHREHYGRGADRIPDDLHQDVVMTRLETASRRSRRGWSPRASSCKVARRGRCSRTGCGLASREHRGRCQRQGRGLLLTDRRTTLTWRSRGSCSRRMVRARTAARPDDRPSSERCKMAWRSGSLWPGARTYRVYRRGGSVRVLRLRRQDTEP